MKVETLARLIAISEELTDHGMLNLQKLLESLVYSIIRIESRAFRRDSDPAERIADLAEIMAVIQKDVISTDFHDLISQVVRRYTEKPSGDLTFREAPDIFVCRNCGYTTFGSAEESCDACGSASGVFRRFRGMFNGDNSEPENPLGLINKLDDNARQIGALVADLGETDCTRNPFPNRWNIRDHVAHFFDAQAVLISRVEIMLKVDRPELASAVPYVTALETDGRPVMVKDIMKAYLTDRYKFTDNLRERPSQDLWRLGRHEDFGLVSIMHQVKYFAQHEQAHIGSVVKLREAVSIP